MLRAALDGQPGLPRTSLVAHSATWSEPITSASGEARGTDVRLRRASRADQVCAAASPASRASSTSGAHAVERHPQPLEQLAAIKRRRRQDQARRILEKQGFKLESALTGRGASLLYAAHVASPGRSVNALELAGREAELVRERTRAIAAAHRGAAAVRVTAAHRRATAVCTVRAPHDRCARRRHRSC